MQRTRILVLSQLPPPHGGLSNNMELYLSSSLFDGYDVTCVNLSGPAVKDKDPDRPSLRTALKALRVVVGLPITVLRVRPSLVYLKAGTKWGFFRDMLLILIARVLGPKVICHLHSKASGTLVLDNTMLRGVFRRVMRVPHAVIVCSDPLAAGFSELIDPAKMVVVHDVVRTSEFEDATSNGAAGAGALPEGSSKAAPPMTTILFVGRMSAAKGVPDLARVAAELIAQEVSVRFELAGQPESTVTGRRVVQRCRRPELRDHLTLLGTIRGREKLDAFARADIFVLPTHNDNQPNTIMEAMAAGLPVVSTTVGEIPDMVEDGVTGFVVEPGDLPALARRLVELTESPALRARMGDAGRDKAARTYDVEIGVEKLRKLFRSTLAGEP